MRKSVEPVDDFQQTDMSLVFLSLLLVLITFFLVLTRFVEPDPAKVSRFKKHYSTFLFFNQQVSVDKEATQAPDIFSESDPLISLVNRMKASGITEPLMNQYLTLLDIKNLKVVSGESGLVIRLPRTIKLDGDTGRLTNEEKESLGNLRVLFMELPFIIEIKGVGYQKNDQPSFQSLELSVTAAQTVYNHLIKMGVIPDKLKVSGMIDDGKAEPVTDIEISFRENA